MGFRQDLRAAAVELFTDYGQDAGIKLQSDRARPVTIRPPTAFVDGIRETLTYPGATLVQRTPVADCILVHGIFDSGDAADQADAFMDGFLDWVSDDVHAAGANTTLGLVSVEDEPAWQPDWRPANTSNGPEPIYYATRLTLEGFAGG